MDCLTVGLYHCVESGQIPSWRIVISVAVVVEGGSMLVVQTFLYSVLSSVCLNQYISLVIIDPNADSVCPDILDYGRLRNRSTRVRTPVALLRSLSGKYP